MTPTRSDITKQGGRIVVAIAGNSPQHDALVRGYQLAQACEAELVVVRVLERVRPMSRMLFPQRHSSDLSASLDAEREMLENGAAECDHVLPEPLGDRYIVRRGTFIEEVTAEALRSPTRLIVLTADLVEPRYAVTLANDVGVPVMLARPRTTNSLVVAATDLRREHYPVLHEAADLAPALAADMLCVHNRAPVIVPPIDPLSAMFFAMPPLEAPNHDGTAELRAAAGEAGFEGQAMVTKESRAADAILDVARATDADLIVVGASRHDSMYRWLTGSTAGAVLRRARRSVLVAPLGTTGAHDAN